MNRKMNIIGLHMVAWTLAVWLCPVFTGVAVGSAYTAMPSAADTFTYVKTMDGHPGSTPQGLAFFPDARFLMSVGSVDYTVKIWDVDQGALVRSFVVDRQYTATLSADGRLVASIGGDNGTVRISNPHTGELLKTLTGDRNVLRSVRFSPDGKALASHSSDLGGGNTLLILRDVSTWNILRTIETGHYRINGYERGDFSPDNRTVATAGDQSDGLGEVKLWDAQTGSLKLTLTIPRLSSGVIRSVGDVRFSPDGKTIAVSTGHYDPNNWLTEYQILIWDAQSGALLKTLTSPAPAHTFTEIAFSPSGRTLVATGHSSLWVLWDLQTAAVIQRGTVSGRDSVFRCAFSSDGKTLAFVGWSGSYQGKIHIWQRSAGGGGEGLTLKSSTFFGGVGDQRGTGISIGGGKIHLSGHDGTVTADEVNAVEAMAMTYPIPPASSPSWSARWPSGNAGGIAGTDIFWGVASTDQWTYYPGTSYSQTTDGVGGKEKKAVIAMYQTGSSSPMPATVAKPKFFAYTGHEILQAATITVEGNMPVVYATGLGEPCSYAKFILGKFHSTGLPIAMATEAGFEPNFTRSCAVSGPGFSEGSAVTTLNGNVYTAGYSYQVSGEDAVHRPVLARFDSNLNRVWRRRPATVAGFFRGVTAVGGAIYAAGNTLSPGVAGSEDFLIQKYDEAGNLVWSKTWGGATEDRLSGVIGIGQRLFAVGSTKSDGAGGSDAYVCEIDPVTGNVLSKSLFGGLKDEIANGAASDGVDLYVVGEARSFATAPGNAVGQNEVMLLRYAIPSSPKVLAPVPNAGPDQTMECASHAGTTVRLDGSKSVDPNAPSQPLTYAWSGSFGAATGMQPLVKLSKGTHKIVLTVSNSKLSATDDVMVTVQDSTPPNLVMRVTRPYDGILWPPNKKLMPVQVSVLKLSDSCDLRPKLSLVSITIQEMEKDKKGKSSKGDADQRKKQRREDIVDAKYGTMDLNFQLRATKGEKAVCRIYLITYAATDASGNQTAVTLAVEVPHDRKKRCITQGKPGAYAGNWELKHVMTGLTDLRCGDNGDLNVEYNEGVVKVDKGGYFKQKDGTSRGYIAPTGVVAIELAGHANKPGSAVKWCPAGYASGICSDTDTCSGDWEQGGSSGTWTMTRGYGKSNGGDDDKGKGDDKEKGDDKGKGDSKGKGDDKGTGNDKNRSGLGDGTNPGQGSGRDNSPNQGTKNPNQSGDTGTGGKSKKK